MISNDPPAVRPDPEVPQGIETRAAGWDWDALDAELRPRLIQAGMKRFRLTREDAEDLVQRVFTKMVILDPRARDPVGYLKASFVNACLNHVRDRSRAPRNLALEDETEDLRARTILRQLEDMTSIKQAMRDLLPQCRRLISRYFLQHRSLADIGREIGVTDKQAWRKIYACVDRLKATLCP